MDPVPPGDGSEHGDDLEILQRAMGDPELRAAIEKRWRCAHATALVQDRNGAGLVGDAALREFAREYNRRTLVHGLDMMPSSWNVARAFFAFESDLGVFVLHEENDCRLSLEDYLDWYTDPSSSFSPDSLVDCTESERVYHFNNVDDPAALTFESSGRVLGVASLSLVRVGPEVSVACVFGQVGDSGPEVSELLEAMADGTAFPGRETLAGSSELETEVVGLDSSHSVWRHVALARFDVEQRTIQVRYVLRDLGDRYDVITDDPTCAFDSDGAELYEGAERTHRTCIERLEDYEVIFETVRALLGLPEYFRERESDATEYRIATRLEETREDDGVKEALTLIPRRRHHRFRRVAFLDRRESSSGVDERVLRHPEMAMEVSGFWKTLDPGVFGVDRKGQPVQGRTWVHQTLSWEAAPRAADLIVRRSESRRYSDADRGGFIYVLRSPMHPEDVFKIGRTERSAEVRAAELSRTTGAPERLYVMNKWETADCVEAERIIHERLGEYRVSPRREFFRVPFEVATGVVSSCVGEINRRHDEA